MKVSLSLSCALLMLLSVACKRKAPEFNEQLTVSVHESIEYDGARNAMLTFETEKSFTCGASSIVGEVSQSGSDINVKIEGILTPVNCQYDPGHIKRMFNLGALADGSYNVKVSSGKNQSSGTLVITSGEISLSFSSLSNLRLQEANIRRVPQQIIWGNVLYMDGSMDTVVSGFIDSLGILGAIPTTLPDGNYHFFNVTDGKPFTIYNNLRYFTHRRDFLFRFTGATDSLYSLVLNHANRHQPANFFVRTWDGRSFDFPGPPIALH